MALPPARVRLWWESRWGRRLLFVTGARCPLTKPVVTAVGLLRVGHRAPDCSRGVQPGSIYAYVVHREPTPGRVPGSGWRRGRKRFLRLLPSSFFSTFFFWLINVGCKSFFLLLLPKVPGLLTGRVPEEEKSRGMAVYRRFPQNRKSRSAVPGNLHSFVLISSVVFIRRTNDEDE
jgi:hypothetical protein